MASEDRVAEYRQAYDEWQKHLTGLHEFFLDGKRLDPIKIKGLLNRESRAKRRYDRARLALLGIEEDPELSEDDGEGDE